MVTVFSALSHAIGMDVVFGPKCLSEEGEAALDADRAEKAPISSRTFLIAHGS